MRSHPSFRAGVFKPRANHSASPASPASLASFDSPTSPSSGAAKTAIAGIAAVVSMSIVGLGVVGCSKTPASPDPAKGDATASATSASGGVTGATGTAGTIAPGKVPPNATACPIVVAAGDAGGGNANAAPSATSLQCFRFASTEDAFKYVLSKDPLILAIGEAHAQKGTEAIASSTKRFTDTFLPIVSPRATDVVVELWAPDPKCMKEVRVVASAQKPVTDVQASTNQNEYVVLGNKAKESGMTPWLLRPTCDDFSMLADAGADTVGTSLGLIKRLTQTRLTQLYNENQKAGEGPSAPAGGATRDAGAKAAPPASVRTKNKMVIAYGGALHNDLAPSEAMKEYTFGPELDRMTQGRYIELDLIVPEFVKKSSTWERLPWFASFEAEHAPAGGSGGTAARIDKATVYVVGDKSFVIVFPSS